MNPFKKDRHYFLKYFTLNLFIFSGLNAILFAFRPLHFEIHFNYLSALSIVTGLVFGLISATAFHNTSHGNIKPRVMNDIIGELSASFSLEDIRCFTVGHMLHHMHVDDPLLDPHPPQGLTFFQFIARSRQRTMDCITHFYFKHHGKNASSQINIYAQIVIFHLASLMKLTFWFMLFSPAGFIYFYIPAFLSYFFGFAHLNYVSHRDEKGETMLNNHYDTAFYKFMNVLTSGGYYHKNHHLSPGLYNPSKLK